MPYRTSQAHGAANDGARMPRFTAVEGLRGWLAWAVVFSHISQSLGMEMGGGHWVWFGRAGDTAVFTFIAISGFVIAGLVLDKHEPWPTYILRRAFRIFPAYWIAYAFALAVLPFAIAALTHMPWSRDPAFTFDDLLLGWSQTMAQHHWAQIILHAALLQGVVPDNVLPYAGTAVLGPAWSLTLEWQFYLIAPAFVWLMTSKRWRVATTLAIVAAAVAFKEGAFGHYFMPTFLPGVAYIFMIGIACRAGFNELKRAPLAPEVMLACLGIGLLFSDFLWLGVWFALLTFLLNEERWRTGAGPLPRIASAALESRAAQYFGARSYSVYLVHLPLIQIITWFLVTRIHLTQIQLFVALIVTVIPAVMITSDLMHRAVERPMIALGARIARGLGKTPHAHATP